MMYNPFSLTGKTILVTGASSGIGRAIAIECSKMGASLIITGRDETRLQKTHQDLEGNGHHLIIADLTDEGQINALVEQLPPLNGVVHSAGISMLMPAKFIDKEDFTDIFNINVVSVILLNKYLISHKKLQVGVAFVFISSTIPHAVSIGNTLYGASKGALTIAAKCLGKELLPIKARVNIISPAMVETPLIEILTEEDRKIDALKYPLGYGKPEDVAYCAVYLLSDAAKWITCSEFILDGGLLINL